MHPCMRVWMHSNVFRLRVVKERKTKISANIFLKEKTYFIYLSLWQDVKLTICDTFLCLNCVYSFICINSFSF